MPFGQGLVPSTKTLLIPEVQDAVKIGRVASSILILTIWMTAVGWQVRREYFKPELARLAEGALSLAPGVNFYTLEMNGRAIGSATSRLDTVSTGFVIEDLMTIELPALGQTGSATARTNVSLDPMLRMSDFNFSLTSGVGTFLADGTVHGDSAMDVRVDAGGGEEQFKFRLEEAPVFAAALPIRIAAGEGLEVGREIRVPVFDPSTLSTRTVEVRILEHDTLSIPDSAAWDSETDRWEPARYDSVPAWRVAEAYGGVEVESWIDDDGRVLEASSALGFTMIRTEYELARQALADAEGRPPVFDDDVIFATAVQSNVDLGEIENHSELRFVLSGVDLEGFDLDGGRQELRGDTLTIRRENWNTLEAGYSLPYKRMDLAEALQPEPLIQSDDPRIINKAKEFTAWSTSWEHDPKTVTRQLTRSVHGLLHKEITFSVPSAIQVLESEQGDCNEHTVLFVAMARALGLPARTAVGLVYVDGAFYYHAWPEVWLGEWVATDPTFDQYPADAAHIRFVIGGLAQQVEIIRLIGRLNIDVITPEEAQ